MRSSRAALAGFGLSVLLTVAPAASAAAAGVEGEIATGTAPASVVISEFTPSGFRSTDEFVELHNTSGRLVSLDGWELWACLSSSFPVLLAVFSEADEMAPGGHLLIAHRDSSTGPTDRVYGGIDVPDDGGWLVNDWSSGQFDAVGLRKGIACTEGDPAPQCDWAAGEDIARDAVCTDTDDNLSDFTCKLRTPGF